MGKLLIIAAAAVAWLVLKGSQSANASPASSLPDNTAAYDKTYDIPGMDPMTVHGTPEFQALFEQGIPFMQAGIEMPLAMARPNPVASY